MKGSINDCGNSLTFWNGSKMPLVGLGTWQSSDDEVKSAINSALEAGYRHIDAAYLYRNEAAIGEVLQEWIQSGRIKREELFITTKLPFIGNQPDKVGHFLQLSLQSLRLEYVDLYLIHFPVGFVWQNDVDLYPRDENNSPLLDFKTDHAALWKAMEAQVDAGRVKSIGLSNFNEKQIDMIVKNARIKPANLQVEVHAYFQQKSLRSLCEKHGITVCAYGPLGSKGRSEYYSKLGVKAPEMPNVLKDPLVQDIARKHSKTCAQILLRHLIQLNVVVVPKSASTERIRENIDIFDFQLSQDEMTQLGKLDQNLRSFEFDEFIPNGSPNHPEFPFE